MKGLLLLGLRSAQGMLRAAAPLLLIPPGFFLLCSLLEGRIGFDGLLPLLLFGLWLPLPLMALQIRTRLPFLGPGDPSLPWALQLPLPKGLFRLFPLGGALLAGLILQLLVSTEVSLGILSLDGTPELREAELLPPHPGNPPLLSHKHPIQSFACPNRRGRGQLSFRPRRFLFDAGGDRLRITFQPKGGPPRILKELGVGSDPRRKRLTLDLPEGEGELQFALAGRPHGPISLERAPVYWLGRPLSSFEAGPLLFSQLLPWAFLLVCGGFAASAFLPMRSFTFVLLFLSLVPILAPGFPGPQLGALRLGAITPLPLDSSTLWPLLLPALSLIPPSRRGGRR